MLPDFDIYHISDLRDEIQNVVEQASSNLPFIVSRGVAMKDTTYHEATVITEVVDCLKDTAINPNSQETMFRGPSWDAITFLQDGRMSHGHEQHTAATLPVARKVVLKHRKRKGGELVVPKCGAPPGGLCHKLGDMDQKEFIKFLIEDKQRKFRSRLAANSNKWGSDVIHSYIEKEMSSDLTKLLSCPEHGNAIEHKLNTSMYKDAFRILKSESDYKDHFKMKYFSLKDFSSRIRSEMFKVAGEMLNQSDPLCGYRYNPLLMKFSSDKSSPHLMNLKFCEKLITVFDKTINNYIAEIKSEQDRKPAFIDKKKIINSIKFHNINMKPITVAGRYKISKKDSQVRLKVLLMPEDEYLAIIEKYYRQNYLNKKDFDVPKHYRRSLSHTLSIVSDSSCARSLWSSCDLILTKIE
jgi:hypothetical protein